MADLVRLSDVQRETDFDFRSEGLYDPMGEVAYGGGNQSLGAVRDALLDPNGARIRYLVVQTNEGYGSKSVVVPIGLARIEDDGLHLDLTPEQINTLTAYDERADYTYDAQTNDERALRGGDYGGTVGHRESATTATESAAQQYNYRDEDTADRMFKTPDRLRLLEERLTVGKERYQAGSVQIGKHVENREQNVNVNLSHEEVVIERHPVTSPQPVEGNVQLGSDSQTVRVDLEAERAEVHKQAYVTEEVEIGKRTETEARTFSETVGREVLDVNQTGNLEGRVADRNDRGLLEQAGDRLEDGTDRLDGTVDRDRNQR